MPRLLRFSPLLGLVWAFSSSPIGAQEPDTVAQAVAGATAAAERWLALVDQGEYAASWDSASSAFRTAIAQGAWIHAVTRARAPLEPFGARQLLGSRYETVLPNAPPGRYVILQYETEAGGNRMVIETVVPNQDTDGVWRVGGYFVRPR